MNITSEKQARIAIKLSSKNWLKIPTELRYLWEDDEFIEYSIKYQSKVYNYISTELRKDLDYVYKLFLINNSIFIWFDPVLKRNGDFMLKCMKINYQAYRYTSPELKNLNFLKKALAINSKILFLINPLYYSMREIVIPPILHDLSLVLNIPLPVEIIEEIIKLNGLALEYIDTNNHILLQYAINNNHEAYQFLTEAQKNNVELNYKLIRANSKIYNLIPISLRRDIDFFKKALFFNPDIIFELDESRKYNTQVIAMAYYRKNTIFDTNRFPIHITTNFFGYIRSKVLEYKSFCLVLYETSPNLALKREKQRIIKETDDQQLSRKRHKSISYYTLTGNLKKLNYNGPYFAKLFMQNIYKYIGIDIKRLRLYTKIAIMAKLI